MNKKQKVDALYKMAKGKGVNLTSQQRRELGKYSKDFGAGHNVTRGNIERYVNARDKGRTRLSFNDFANNHLLGDRRKKSGRADSIRQDNKNDALASIFLGWFTWGIALYWINGGNASVGSCAVFGAIVSVILSFVARRYSAFTVFLLPIILAVIAYMKG